MKNSILFLGFKIKIHGEAKTSWKIGKHRFRGHEVYFSNKYYHVGGESKHYI